MSCPTSFIRIDRQTFILNYKTASLLKKLSNGYMAKLRFFRIFTVGLNVYVRLGKSKLCKECPQGYNLGPARAGNRRSYCEDTREKNATSLNL